MVRSPSDASPRFDRQHSSVLGSTPTPGAKVQAVVAAAAAAASAAAEAARVKEQGSGSGSRSNSGGPLEQRGGGECCGGEDCKEEQGAPATKEGKHDVACTPRMISPAPKERKR